jgi:hypothetical protein
MDGLHITGLYFYFQFSLNQINELISQDFTFFLCIDNHSNVVFSTIQKFENVWFYNCNVYAKPEGKSRIRYDLFDNIDEKLKKKLKEGN